MKYTFLKLLVTTKMELFAPVSGGSVGIFAWAMKLAPLVSILAASIGIVLGVMSYMLKRKQIKLEMEYYITKTKELKN